MASFLYSTRTLLNQVKIFNIHPLCAVRSLIPSENMSRNHLSLAPTRTKLAIKFQLLYLLYYSPRPSSPSRDTKWVQAAWRHQITRTVNLNFVGLRWEWDSRKFLSDRNQCAISGSGFRFYGMALLEPDLYCVPRGTYFVPRRD